MALTTEVREEGLPDPRAADPRQAPRLPRLGVVVAEAAAVLDAMQTYYETTHANVHRGVYAIAEESTRLSRRPADKVGPLHRAPSRGASSSPRTSPRPSTSSPLVGRANLRRGDAVLLTEIEHHANLVPWLMLQEERGIELRFLPMAEDYTLDLSELDR
jgi:cysteine desulfurase/selenocysteine lyase